MPHEARDSRGPHKMFMKVVGGPLRGCAQELLTISANSLEVMSRASSVSCSLDLKPISDCLLCSISFRPLPSLPLAQLLAQY
jgi:hypothetical protein